MKIVELRSENVKRLKAVHIKPDGSVVQITGKNGEGKSSVLDSIWYALGGTSTHPDEPIRRGTKEAKVVLDLGDLKVTRRWHRRGNTYLTVEAADGSKVSSPQKALDALTGRLTFDPLAFSRMDARKQAETLRELTGLDFSEHDSERQRAFEKRTDVNREVKRLEAQLGSMPEPEGGADDCPDPVDVASLTKELADGHANNQRVEAVSRALELREAEIAQLSSEIRRLTAKLEAAKHERNDLRRRDSEQTRVDIEAIENRLNEAEETNERIWQVQQRAAEYNRQVEAREDILSQLRKETDAAEVLTAGLRQMDEKKAAAIATAKMPIDGLAFDEDGISLGGVPFQQASHAEQLRASVAMGLALNPELRVMLIREGSCLDSTSLGLIQEMAEEADAQVWLERVTDGEPVGVVIEDGSTATEDNE